MFSREQATQLRQEFWTAFGKSFPKKWILYNTKIKGFYFKFHFDNKKAMVFIEIEGDKEHQNRYFEKLESLESILKQEYWEDAVFSPEFYRENQKQVACVWVEKTGVSIYNKNTWQEAMQFLYDKMTKIEEFWLEYEDFFKMD